MSSDIFNPSKVMDLIEDNVKLKAQNIKLHSDIDFLKTLLQDTEKERNELNDKLELIEKDLLIAIDDNANMFKSLTKFFKNPWI